MADLEAYYRITLKNNLAGRKEKNSSYSLRSFARFLGCDPTFLSKLTSGKLLLSVDRADTFSRKLALGEKDRAQFILSAADEQRCHALYLIDPTLTDCDLNKEASNKLPQNRKRLAKA